jgi:hypothetical protein
MLLALVMALALGCSEKSGPQDAAQTTTETPTQVNPQSPKATVQTMRDALAKKDLAGLTKCVVSDDPKFQKAYAGILMGGLKSADLAEAIKKRGLSGKLGMGANVLKGQAQSTDPAFLEALIKTGVVEIKENKASIVITKEEDGRKSKKTLTLYKEGEGWKMGVPENAKESVQKVSIALPTFYASVEEALGKDKDDEAVAAFKQAYEVFKSTVSGKPMVDKTIPAFPTPPYATPELVFNAAWIANRSGKGRDFFSCFSKKALADFAPLAAQKIAMEVRLKQAHILGPEGYFPGLAKKHGLEMSEFEKREGEKGTAYEKRIATLIKSKGPFLNDWWEAANTSYQKVFSPYGPKVPALTGLKTQTNKATAKTASWKGMGGPRDVKFVKKGGTWLIDSVVGL